MNILIGEDVLKPRDTELVDARDGDYGVGSKDAFDGVGSPSRIVERVIQQLALALLQITFWNLQEANAVTGSEQSSVRQALWLTYRR